MPTATARVCRSMPTEKPSRNGRLKQGLLLLEPFDLTHQFFHSILQAGILAPKQVQTIQQLFLLDLCPLQRSLQSFQLQLDLFTII